MSYPPDDAEGLRRQLARARRDMAALLVQRFGYAEMHRQLEVHQGQVIRLYFRAARGGLLPAWIPLPADGDPDDLTVPSPPSVVSRVEAAPATRVDSELVELMLRALQLRSGLGTGILASRGLGPPDCPRGALSRFQQAALAFKSLTHDAQQRGGTPLVRAMRANPHVVLMPVQRVDELEAESLCGGAVRP